MTEDEKNSNKETKESTRSESSPYHQSKIKSVIRRNEDPDIEDD